MIMLRIQYGEMDGVAYGPVWFKHNYELTWFQDPLVRDMLLDIDKSRYITGSIIESDVLGPIPPLSLSGGLKTVILIYERPDIIFDATSCGPNCAKWILEIGRRKDITVNLRYYMPMDGLAPFEIEIVNANRIVTTEEDFALTSLDYL